MVEEGGGRAAAQAGGMALSEGARVVARGLRRPSLAPSAIGGVAFLLDTIALALGLWFASFASGSAAYIPFWSAINAAAVALTTTLILWTCGMYRLPALRRFAAGAMLLLAIGVGAATAMGSTAAGTAGVVVCILPARALGAALAVAALDFGLTERRAVIIGGGERASQVMAALAGSDIHICGIFDDRDDARSPPVVDSVPKLGTLASLVTFVRTAEIDMLIVALPLSAERRIAAVLKAVEILPVDVRLADFSDDPTFRRRGGLIDLASRPLRDGERAAKRVLDVVGAAVALVLLSPLFALTALAIRLDTPGPIFFRQPRHGYNHRR